MPFLPDTPKKSARRRPKVEESNFLNPSALFAVALPLANKAS